MSRVVEEMQRAVEEKIFPGAALLVAIQGEIIFRDFFGDATLLPKPARVTEKTLFDIASLTKPVSIATMTLAALRDKGLSLNGYASKYLNNLEGEKEKITIRHLLKHTSGFPAWRPYYEEIAREHPEVLGRRESRVHYLEKIAAEPLEMPVAYQRIYSDLGYILLGILLEDFFSEPLDRLFQEKVTEPLELSNTFYVPVGAKLPCPYESFAATEESAWRKKLIQGEVHDDNAYALGGVAGHAGLFSTVDDLDRFLRSWGKAYRGGSSPWPRDLVHDFIGPKVKIKLGWDTCSQEGSQTGRYFSKNSIGHLGYSGCSFWADLDQDFHIILLTNRIHPSAQNEGIKQFRPKIHDLIYEEIIRERVHG